MSEIRRLAQQGAELLPQERELLVREVVAAAAQDAVSEIYLKTATCFHEWDKAVLRRLREIEDPEEYRHFAVYVELLRKQLSADLVWIAGEALGRKTL